MKAPKLEGTNDTSEFMTTQQLAARLGVGTSTIEAWRYGRGGGPPYVRLGHGRRALVRYKRADVEAWIAVNTIEGGAS